MVRNFSHHYGGKSWLSTTCRFDLKLLRHPQANTSERCMGEISKFCKLFCSQNHRKWAEVLPKIEEWLNTTVADSTGYTPVELLFQAKKRDLFEKIFTKSPENLLNQKLWVIKLWRHTQGWGRRQKTEGNGERRETRRGNLRWSKRFLWVHNQFRCTGRYNG